MKVLLVENHADTANYLRAYLRGLEHEVSVAQCLTEAREALRSSEFAVLISDISLPDGSGWELKPDLAASGIYAVAMTGFCTEEDQLKSLDAGFRHHLIKPFLPSDLDAILRMVERQSGSLSAA